MPTDNKISITITEEDKTAINAALSTLKTKLQSYLIALTPDERHALPKMSDKTVPFVDKCLSYASTNPEFAPPYINLTEMSKDVQVVDVLGPIYGALQQLTSNVEDTIMLAGSEAYVTSLAYYNTAKEAVKRDIPNAKTIYEDLKQRFPQTGRPATSVTK